MKRLPEPARARLKGSAPDPGSEAWESWRVLWLAVSRSARGSRDVVVPSLSRLRALPAGRRSQARSQALPVLALPTTPYVESLLDRILSRNLR